MAIEDHSLEETASRWLARRDRGFLPEEQDEFLQWLRDDPKHAAAFAHLDRTWSALDKLAEWRPAHGTVPNPDLLVPTTPQSPRARWRRPMVITSIVGLAAAVAVVVYLNLARIPFAQSEPTAGVVRHAPDRMTLPDGSTVDLNVGARVEVAFSAAERRVRLVNGTAHFSVMTDPGRPFIVHAGKVSIRAVGTAFLVQHDVSHVEVLVTEGKVRLGWSASNDVDLLHGATTEAPMLIAGEQAMIDLSGPVAVPVVKAVAAEAIDRALAWQRPLLEFDDLPLAVVVAEFNRHNVQQLVVGDDATGALLVGGTFRADNVDGFVRLLEASFGVKAERRDGHITVLKHDR